VSRACRSAACGGNITRRLAAGVTLWEIFANAEEPYSGMANDVEVGVFVRRGGRLGAPRDMCDDLLRDARLAALGRAVLSDLYQVHLPRSPAGFAGCVRTCLSWWHGGRRRAECVCLQDGRSSLRRCRGMTVVWSADNVQLLASST
jgi:hypothetical protein